MTIYTVLIVAIGAIVLDRLAQYASQIIVAISHNNSIVKLQQEPPSYSVTFDGDPSRFNGYNEDGE